MPKWCIKKCPSYEGYQYCVYFRVSSGQGLDESHDETGLSHVHGVDSLSV